MKINIQQVPDESSALPTVFSEKDLNTLGSTNVPKHLTLTIKLSNSNDGSDLDHPPHFSDWLTQPKNVR